MAEASVKKTSAVSQLLPGWIIAFTFCFMLFIYEPLVMYATNMDDFWFDLGMIAAPMFEIFLVFFIGSAAVLSGLFFLFKLLKKPAVYQIIVTGVFVVFAATYTQGNFLAGNLPALDGSEIDWSLYSVDNVITLVVWAVLLAGWIFALKNFGADDVMKLAALASAAFFVMLTVSMVSVCVKNDAFRSKDSFVSSGIGLNGASDDKNFFIFMVDSQSASEFTEVISDEEFDGAFDDFTYYPDTLSAFAYTRDSVPYVLSGIMNMNEEEFWEYSSKALNDSVLFKELDSRGYDMYLYSDEISWYGDKSFTIKNADECRSSKIRFGDYFTEEMRYVRFKYLPYAFKKLSDIENMDFNSMVKMFNWRNDALYEDFTDVSRLEKSPGAQFRMIHAEGAHVPMDMDEDLNRIKGGTYIQKTTATAKLIRAFIERLKQAGVYDNSAIIIMGDHGYQPFYNPPENYILSRFNSVLLIKGFGEHHDFEVSDKPVSYFDLPQAYIDLLDGKQSAELFPEAEYPRTRTVIWYEYCKEEHMEEYQTDGKATEWDKFINTGKVYDLD